eukprot:9188297-Ditylum_brightwellii.AAC.1
MEDGQTVGTTPTKIHHNNENIRPAHSGWTSQCIQEIWIFTKTRWNVRNSQLNDKQNLYDDCTATKQNLLY